MKNVFSTFKTIKYYYTNSNRANLAIIFPQAMQTSSDLRSLINMLTRVANVIFIESGYYGITRINSSKQIHLYSSVSFRENLHELLKKYKYKKLYLVAGSVGAIHALSFLEAYSNEITAVALAGPALYRDRGSIINNLYKLLLSLGIYYYPDRYFQIVTNLFKNNPKVPWLEKTYNHVVNKIGALSYFLCLREIIEFTSKSYSRLENLLSQKVHIFLGNKDSVFNLLCDKGLCSKAKTCELIESNHSALNGAKLQIFKLLSHAKN